MSTVVRIAAGATKTGVFGRIQATDADNLLIAISKTNAEGDSWTDTGLSTGSGKRLLENHLTHPGMIFTSITAGAGGAVYAEVLDESRTPIPL